MNGWNVRGCVGEGMKRGVAARQLSALRTGQSP